MRIRQLPSLLANQIAAGEVIERPASVVKELLENALDANANSIVVDIGYGGLNRIKVDDDGCGIVAEDLPLAISAHATSKIFEMNDLSYITTMGFRGEALASIASVSRMSICSRTACQKVGALLRCYTQPMDVADSPRKPGTTIDVRDIFYNAPVRKKFLKSERSEFMAIEAVVRRFALSAPHINLVLIHNQQTVLQLPAAGDACSLKNRIAKIFGKKFIENSIRVDVTHANTQLQGWLSDVTLQRSQNDRLWVYINARMVRDRLLNNAVKSAYEGLLYPGRFPSGVVFLRIDPLEIDVNVHPTKHEVRFQQPRIIHDFIASNIKLMLAARDESPVRNHYAFQDNRPNLQLKEREPYIASLPSKTKGDEKKIFITLNYRYVIYGDNAEKTLIDSINLHKHWLRQQISKASLPLARRPLLTTVEIKDITVDNKTLETLNRAGFEIETRDKNLRVATLPLIVPELDIKSFFHHIAVAEHLSFADVLELLIHNQTYTTSQLNEYSAEHEHFIKQTNFTDCMKVLNEDNCLKFLELSDA